MRLETAVLLASDLLGPIPVSAAFGAITAAVADERLARGERDSGARSFLDGAARRVGLAVGGASLAWLALAFAALCGREKNFALAFAAFQLWAVGALIGAAAIARAREAVSTNASAGETVAANASAAKSVAARSIAKKISRAAFWSGAFTFAVAVAAALLFAVGPLASLPVTVHGFKGFVDERSLLEFLSRGGIFERAGGASAVVWRARIFCAGAFGAACALAGALTWAAERRPSESRSAAASRAPRRAAA